MVSPPNLQALTEKLCNGFIQVLKSLDNEAYEALAPYQGEVFQLDITDLNVSLYFTIATNNILVTRHLKESTRVKTKLSGQWLNLIKIYFNREGNMATFAQHNLQVEGDTGFLVAFNQTFKDIDIDIEEHLSHIIGDFAAHNVSQALKTGANWLKTSAENRQRDLTLFLQEEIKLLPTKVELEYFYKDVSEIKADGERLELIINRLLQD